MSAWFLYSELLTCLHTVVDVSTQSCTVTPLNPTTLTATAGVLVYGTMDVRIQCICPVTDDHVVRWFHPNRWIIYQQRNEKYVAGSSYVIRNSNTNVTLVIPTFNYAHYGTYNCGIRVGDHSFRSPSAAVNLILGELMIITVSYLHVATYCIVQNGADKKLC